MRYGQHGARAERPLAVLVALVAVILILCLPIGDWVSLILVPFAFLTYELAFGNVWLAKFLSARFLVLLGGASYAVYLLQYPVRSWVRTVFSQLPARVQPIGALLTPLVLVVFSIFVFVYFEEPLRKLLKRFLGQFVRNEAH